MSEGRNESCGSKPLREGVLGSSCVLGLTILTAEDCGFANDAISWRQLSPEWLLDEIQFRVEQQ